MAKKNINIKISVEEVFFDTKNKVDFASRSVYNGKNDEQVAKMKIDGDENAELDVLRSISYAFSVLKTELSEFLHEEGTSANNVLPTKTDVWGVSLSMPTNYNETTREAISMSIHDYMVNYALSVWFQKINGDMSARYFADMGRSLENLKEAMFKRNRPTRNAVTLPTDGRRT